MQRLVIRVDGNSSIGLGHIMRCLSIADFVSCRFSCLFILSDSDENAQSLINASGNELKKISPNLSTQDETRELSNELNERDLLLLDGYQFDIEYQKEVRRMVKKLILIDDFIDRSYSADLVINYSNEPGKFRERSSDGKVLAGFDYLILRRPFLQAARHQGSPRAEVRTVLLTMGGADPENLTSRLLNFLVHLETLKAIHIVTGSSFKWLRELHETAATLEKSVTVHQNLDAEQLVSLMRSCDVAIAPSSSMALEICCVKVPLLTGYFAENQLGLYRNLVNTQCGLPLGDLSQLESNTLRSRLSEVQDMNLQKSMLESQARTFDGRSEKRILAAFENLIEC